MRQVLAMSFLLLSAPHVNAAEVAPPRSELVYEAIVDIAPSVSLGQGPLGERRMVPITGGEFHGAGLSGKVLPGGADRQLIRSDGVRQLDAIYEMQTDDGVIISVRNEVLVRGEGADRYAFSKITLNAPSGRYEWLNQSLFIGTLSSLRPARNAVSIKAWRVY
ncbi:DUF3237 domain-containing protein [Pseudomonas sp. DTU_2021_1001937_2_SI_NGA_ILE_001]|uniref:DUF3237 domain-containing protein n=1 Tax=Pseudomonas sp. DTU_2021_1001937_2_SI_NGA_ILE_001 TaxID=3077589 RepID=UPI0028FC0B07|nr:DUF3237 domain-containing protein [Pseudomonas sp. DTU_2021_1001937_2_SI_NGA_ILE_001]WNW09947.1 DUF3237 domain-containing protein [Pseudomonas sp. DTU_2021_1001937_2_SI_NGA_ILE_001]